MTLNARPRDYADEQVETDVHLLILDYLAHNATQALLDDLDLNPPASGHHVDTCLTDNHLELFNSCFALSVPKILSGTPAGAAPSSLAPGLVALRIQLLQFVTGYHTNRNPSRGSRRFAPQSLQSLRQQNYKRAILWADQQITEDDLTPERPSQLLEMREYTNDTDRWSSVPQLLDLIPSFIALTAARMTLRTVVGSQDPDEASQSEHGDEQPNDWRICEALLHLAAEMMLQAALEDQSTSFATTSFLAFCWGSVEVDKLERDMDHDGNDEDGLAHAQLDGSQESNGLGQVDADAVNSIFGARRTRSRASSNSSEMDLDQVDWQSIRRTYQDYAIKLDPTQGESESQDIRAAHTMEQFHATLTGYIRAISSSIATPLLTQLEHDGEDILLEDLELTSEESARLRAIAKGTAR